MERLNVEGFWEASKDLSENNLSTFATKLGADLDGTIEENPRHSRAMGRAFRLRRVQRWSEDWPRHVQVIFTQILSMIRQQDSLLIEPKIVETEKVLNSLIRA